MDTLNLQNSRTAVAVAENPVAPQAQNPQKTAPLRLEGVDPIRFFAALWVVLFHGTPPPIFEIFDRSTQFGRIARGLLDCLFCGPAAVIVFFVISGLCIHYPYSRGEVLNLRTFLARRYVRLLLPVVAVVVLAKLLVGDVGRLWSLLLWSLYCELVYYTIYPVFLKWVRRNGWKTPLVLSCVASLALTAFTGIGGMYARIDLWDPVLGFPCWLFGCLLADRIAAGNLPVDNGNRWRIWLWRIGAWIGSSATLFLMLHTPVGLRVSLLIYACFAYFWLAEEIRYAHRSTNQGVAIRLLNLAGMASFSLYLTHPIAAKCVSSLSEGWPLPATAIWSIHLAAALIIAGIFYICVEHPSHLVARSIGR